VLTAPDHRTEAPRAVVVVGGGIGGLTAALAFAKAGFSVEVIERAERLQEAGAGLQLSPNALSTLTALGIETAELNGIAATSVTLRSGPSGRRIAEVPVAASDGTAYLSLHRADLQAALLAAVRRQTRIVLTLGAACTAAQHDGQGWQLEFSSAAGGTLNRQADIVIAADGVGSAIARLLGHPAAAPSGDIAWRMTASTPPGGTSPRPSAGIAAWLGPRRHAVAYPIRGGRETNLVLIGRASDVTRDPASASAKNQLLARFVGWDPALLGLIASAGPATAWPLSTRVPVAHDGVPAGLFVIGDAAHAMLPYAAQGAAMAIEDAFVAAHCVATHATLEAARQSFDAQRIPRIARVLGRVAFHRRVYHLPFPFSLARNLALSLRPKAALARDLAWLYDWRPPAIDGPRGTVSDISRNG